MDKLTEVIMSYGNHFSFFGFLASLLGLCVSIWLLAKVKKLSKAQSEERQRILKAINISGVLGILKDSEEILSSLLSVSSYQLDRLKGNIRSAEVMILSTLKSLQVYFSDLGIEGESHNVQPDIRVDYRIISWDSFMNDATEYIKNNNFAEVLILAHSARGFLDRLKDPIIQKELHSGYSKPTIKVLVRSPIIEGDYVERHKEIMKTGERYLRELTASLSEKANIEIRYYIIPPLKLRFFSIDENVYLSWYTFKKMEEDAGRVRPTGKGLDVIFFKKNSPLGEYLAFLCLNLFNSIWNHMSFTSNQLAQLTNEQIKELFCQHTNTSFN